MAENVYDVLRNDRPALVEELNKNEELCTFLQLCYSHILEIASANPKDPRDMELNVYIVLDRLLQVSVVYIPKIHDSSGPIHYSKQYWQRNATLVTLLGVNKNVKDLALKVVNALEIWIGEKPYRKEMGLSELRFENGHLWVNNVFTVELIWKKDLDEQIEKKMGWNQEPDEERRIIIP